MKNNVREILMWAILALGILIVISFFAGFFAWIWSKLVIGFAVASCIWIVQKIRQRETGNFFIVWWGIVISALLISIDLLTMFIARYFWLIFVALIIGIIAWAVIKWSKKN